MLHSNGKKNYLYMQPIERNGESAASTQTLFAIG